MFEAERRIEEMCGEYRNQQIGNPKGFIKNVPY
jgi:hypothetical protein